VDDGSHGIGTQDLVGEISNECSVLFSRGKIEGFRVHSRNHCTLEAGRE
jgi:hypothetical protein